MADYKVQMKQYNGTGFDNILPYASQAETLRGGGTASDLITQARAGLCQIATGSYVGNGLTIEGTKMSIIVPFTPKMLIVFPYTSLPWKSMSSSGSRGIGTALLSAVSNNATTIIYSSYQFFIWYDAMDYTALVTVRDGDRYGSQANFSLIDNAVSWALAKPSGADYYEAPTGDAIANSLGQTYHWLAIG